jgi:hypothetical protein
MGRGSISRKRWRADRQRKKKQRDKRKAQQAAKATRGPGA